MLRYYVSDVKKIHGVIREFSWKEFFSDDFISRNTIFKSFNDMLCQSPFGITSSDDTGEFNSIPDDLWDRYVCKTTKFCSWREMHLEAARANATNSIIKQPN